MSCCAVAKTVTWHVTSSFHNIALTRHCSGILIAAWCAQPYRVPASILHHVLPFFAKWNSAALRNTPTSA